MTLRVLTGINTTGTLHLGNYCGAVRPCVRASKRPDTDTFVFMADLHALIKCQDPERLALSRMQIAASWIACGLDPEAVTFYRQSDIHEIPLLNWMFSCVCAKGLMNRAHAYKARVEANAGTGEDPDAGVSMGLFCYPVLMAADILMFNADRVPVGRDQIQHLEMARDIAQRFNQIYGLRKDFFVLPYEEVDESTQTLPGLDGRKMSKSYDNVIPLFEGGEKALRAAIARLVTDSRAPGEPKDPDSCSIGTLYEAFAAKDETEAFRAALRDGMGWGEAKKLLADRINAEIGPMREKYEHFMSRPQLLEDLLMAGAEKARRISVPFMEELRAAVGLRRFHEVRAPQASEPVRTAPKKAAPSLRQYREKDGRFYFKLCEGDRVIFVSSPYEGGREAGADVAKLRAGLCEELLPKLVLGDGVTQDEALACAKEFALLAAEEAERKKQKKAQKA